MEKLYFRPQANFWVEKCSQFHIVLKHIKVPKIEIFSSHQIFSKKNRLIVDNNADSWALMGKSCKNIVVDVHNFLDFVRKQCLHACDFFHVCLQVADTPTHTRIKYWYQSNLDTFWFSNITIQGPSKVPISWEHRYHTGCTKKVQPRLFD